ncbi:MAG: TonB-dependent receptor [Proteobacteria bacterium]|nr:TonB-dependent receptor [Pseudomonadota bacterium]
MIYNTNKNNYFLNKCLRHTFLATMPVAAILFWILLHIIITPDCWASDSKYTQKPGFDLTELTLEELMNVEITVTSVAKKPQKLFEAPSAVFTITTEDIRRSGATNIPEILRMVPGLQVSRINTNKWAITARGFNGRFATKLLVLIDGRTVYSPLFSGVYWDIQDTLIEDIDRIEVIRGPGGSLWGANAVNGVINIITKKAKDTQGKLLTAGIGTEESAFTGIRYGGNLSDKSYYRAYAKYFNKDDAIDSAGDPSNDGWYAYRAGFRIDSNLSNSNTLTFLGDMYDAKAGELLKVPQLNPPFTQTVEDDSNMTGANILARWQHSFANDSDLQMQIYYDRTDRNNLRLKEKRDTFDFDFQNRLVLNQMHEIVWGLGYRLTYDELSDTFFFSFDPEKSTNQLYSGFLQDSITLLKDCLILTLGTKFEHNDYTGFELQPSAKIAWTAYAKHSLWASISRAVRTPDRIEHDSRHNPVVIPGSTPILLSVFGNDDLKHEEVIAYELGYRTQPKNNLSFDIALFYNDYKNLRTFETDTPYFESSPAPAHLVLPNTIDNLMHGKTYGVEIASDYRILDWWRLQGAYTYLSMDLTPNAKSNDTRSEGAEDQSPIHQFSLRSTMDISNNVELDFWTRYVDDLSGLNVGSYLTLDLRIGWKILNNLELSIVGQNLFDYSHSEWGTDRDNHSPSEVERGVYTKITWQF